LINFSLIGLLVGVTTVIAVAACQSSKIEESLSLQDAAALAKTGEVLILDVREKSEVENGMAQPAVWMPMSKIDANDPDWSTLVEKNKEKTFAVYCAVGGRAGTVVKFLKKKNLKAVNLGGFDQWRDAGLPTRDGPDTKPSL
jgi:rhodanese-related sulfurtransferase